MIPHFVLLLHLGVALRDVRAAVPPSRSVRCEPGTGFAFHLLPNSVQINGGSRRLVHVQDACLDIRPLVVSLV